MIIDDDSDDICDLGLDETVLSPFSSEIVHPRLAMMNHHKRDQTLPVEHVYIFTDMGEYNAWIEKEEGVSKSVQLANLIIVGNQIIKSRYFSQGRIIDSFGFGARTLG